MYAAGGPQSLAKFWQRHQVCGWFGSCHCTLDSGTPTFFCAKRVALSSFAGPLVQLFPGRQAGEPMQVCRGLCSAVPVLAHIRRFRQAAAASKLLNATRIL